MTGPRAERFPTIEEADTDIARRIRPVCPDVLEPDLLALVRRRAEIYYDSSMVRDIRLVREEEASDETRKRGNAEER
jgi:hypothetical protein